MDLNLSYRSFVLAIAQNPSVKNLVLTRGKGLSRRFVAGDTLEEALKVVEGLERERIHAILDLLGEMVTSEEMARGFQAEIVGLIRVLGARPYPRYVSVKLTQLGH